MLFAAEIAIPHLFLEKKAVGAYWTTVNKFEEYWTIWTY